MFELNDRQTRVLFAMIRAGLWPDTDVDGLTDAALALDSREWKELFRAAREQAVTGLFTDGLKRMKERPACCDFAYLNGVMLTSRMEKRNRLLAEAALMLKDKYPGSWIFKGPRLTRFYPEPLHRETGDIDLVVPGLKEEAYYTFMFQGESVCVELHPWPEYLTSPLKNRKLQNIIREDYPERRGELSIEVNLLCLILHVRRHVLSDGFGLKQLCDIAVILQNVPYNPERLRFLFSQTGGERFVACLMKLLEEELGVRHICLVKKEAGKKAYALLRKALLKEGYDNKQAWRESSGWVESAWLRWKRCLRLYPLMGSEALWMPFYQAVQRRKRNRC